MNKKGYYFSLSVIILLVIVSVFASTRSDKGFTRQAVVDQDRLLELNDFVLAVQNDASVALSTAALRSFMAIEKDIIREDEAYITGDLDDVLKELVINGSIENGLRNSSLLIDPVTNEQSTLNAWESQISVLASNTYNFEVSIEWLDIHAYQETPWEILVRANYRVLAHDEFTSARWNVSAQTIGVVDVTKLIDPLFTLGTQQKSFQLITRTNVTNFSIDDQMIDHVKYFMYSNNSASPNYLMRLTGDMRLAGNITGIESLVNIDELGKLGMVLPTPPVVLNDWEYFSSDVYEIHVCNHSTLSWLGVTNTTNEFYNITCDDGGTPRPPRDDDSPDISIT